MAKTAINTIKNWFVTGAKPTQEQFWNWMDSFWHKDEKLSQSSIEGLGDTLQAKADRDVTENALKAKADLVAGKVPMEQMPFADDVLDFPAFADFPTTGEVGKIYIDKSEDKPYLWDADSNKYKPAGIDEVWKAAVDTALAKKLDRPTTAGTTATHPNVVGVDAEGNTAGLPAGDLGKNMANTNLTTTAARVLTLAYDYVINTAGKAFKFSNLISAQGDATFTKRPKMRADGTMGQVDESAMQKEDALKAMQSYTDAEKDTYRLASLKTGEKWSLSQPRIDMLSRPIIDGTKSEITYVSLIGLNLFLNIVDIGAAELTMYRVTDENGVAITPTDGVYPETFNINNITVYANSPSTLSFGLDFSTYPKGEYMFKVRHNSLYSLSSPVLLNSNKPLELTTLPNLTWGKYLKAGIIDNDDVESNRKLSGRYYIENPEGTSAQILKTVKSSACIQAAHVVSGFMIELNINMTSERYASFGYGGWIRAGLDYDNDITGGFVPSIMFAYSNSFMALPNGVRVRADPGEPVTMALKIVIVVRNGICTIYARYTDAIKALTTFLFEQKNEPLYFYNSFFGSQSNAWTAKSSYNIELPNTYITF